MQRFILLSIACLAALAPAEAGAAVLPVADSFNRADASDLGPNWDVQTGSFAIAGRQATAGASGLTLATFSGGFGNQVSMDVFHSGTPSTAYAAVVLGYADLNDNLFVKVQSNGSSATSFDFVAFYFGNNGTNNGAWSESGAVLPTPFTQGRITVTLAGNQVTLDIDEDWDGVPEQSFTRGSVPLGLLGDGVGIGFGGVGTNVSVDDFGLAVADSFNRADASDLGPGWDFQVGSFAVAGREATPTVNGSLATFSGGVGNEVSFDAFHSGTPSLTYAAAVLGYADPNDNVFVKVQSISSSASFDRIFFYFGNNGNNNGAWSETGSVATTPFSQARVTVRLIGDSVLVLIDEDWDGVPEQSFSRGSIPLALLGDGVGIGGFGGPHVAIDNFGLATSDSFNRADASDLGPRWDVQGGSFGIVSREAIPTGGSLATFSGGFGNEVSFDAFHSGVSSIAYAAAVIGYASQSDNLFVKVQSNPGSSFNRIFFYFGNNGSNNVAWSETGFVDPVPFLQARVTVRLVGDEVTIEIDEDWDGVPDQSFTRGNVPLGLLGADVGIGGFGGPDVAIDNFQALPEPSAITALGAGVILLAVLAWRRR